MIFLKYHIIQQGMGSGFPGVRSTFFKSLSVATQRAELEGCPPSVHCQPPQKGPGRPWTCHIPETGAWAAWVAWAGRRMFRKAYPLAMITLWSFNIAMDNGLFIDDFPIEPFIYKGFSMAMLNNQMVDR